MSPAVLLCLQMESVTLQEEVAALLCPEPRLALQVSGVTLGRLLSQLWSQKRISPTVPSPAVSSTRVDSGPTVYREFGQPEPMLRTLHQEDVQQNHHQDRD